MGDQEKTEGSGDMADAVVMAIRTADPPIYSEPVAVAAQAVKGMNGPGLGCIRLPNRFTVNQEALDTNFRVALNHPPKMAADLGGNPYPTAQPGEARAINTGPGHVRFTMRTETKGWNFTPDEGLGRLVRARDDFSITAASDVRLWPKQILDFEHREAVWKGALSVPLDTLYGNPDAGRPWPPPAAEIKVTPEMRSAGAALYDAAREDFERRYLDAIYLHAVAPVPLVTEAEDRIVALEKERDHWRAECTRATCRYEARGDALRRLSTEGRIAQTMLQDLGFNPGDLKEPMWRYDCFNDDWVFGGSGLAAALERECIEHCEYISVQAELIAKQASALGHAANTIAAKDARIAELDSELAKRPALIPLGNRPHASDCAVHNEPAGPCNCGAMDKSPNPFRDHGRDPRRMGPL